VIGSGNEVMLPGFVNGHHHIGLTPVQLGSPDMPLELWFVIRMVMRNVNLYLDTLYSAFEMIASGVTTVQHLHGRVPGKLDQVDRGCEEVIRAYRDVGMAIGEPRQRLIGAPMEIGRSELHLDPARIAVAGVRTVHGKRVVH